jgi:hypothetical protein
MAMMGVRTATIVAAGGQPDLVVTDMKIELETGNACYTSTTLGVRVTYKNQGSALASGPFVVQVNSNQQTVTMSIAPGATATVWIPGYQNGNNTGTVDATNQVAESNEGNNTLTQFLAVPTLPLPCTPTPDPAVGGVTRLTGNATDATNYGAAAAIWLLFIAGVTGAAKLTVRYLRS